MSTPKLFPQRFYSERHWFELRMYLAESFRHSHGFRPGQGANGVNQLASRLHRSRHMEQQLQLHRAQLFYICEHRRPPGVRVPLPGAEAAARGVQEDAIKMSASRKLPTAVPRRRAKVK